MTADTPRHVLPNDTPVRVVTVDLHGLSGRDPHPTEAEIGRVGQVVGNRVCDVDDAGVDLADVPAGTVVGEDCLIVYDVELEGGGRFVFAEYELEAAAKS
jgi:hypothetical protein